MRSPTYARRDDSSRGLVSLPCLCPGRRLEARLVGVLEGTVYPALSRLEREGRLTTRLVASHSGPARKYYRPTAAGYAALAAGTASWTTLAEIVNAQLSQPTPNEPIKGP